MEYGLVIPSEGRLQFLLKALDLSEPMMVCDIGARATGQMPPYQMLLDQGAAKLIGFEPNETAFARLQEQEDDSRIYYNAAVGKPGKAVFYDHPLGSLSSLYKLSEIAARYMAKFHWIDRPEVQEIPLTLQGLDKVKGLDRIDVLKIDIQGGELGAIGSGKKVLSEAVMIVTEVAFYPMYEGAPLWRDVDALLSKMGFYLHKFGTVHRTEVDNPMRKSFKHKVNNTQLVDGDAIYVRGGDQPETLSDDQLKHLALAADTISHSYDLVLRCLGELAKRGAISDGVPERYFRRLPDEMKAN